MAIRPDEDQQPRLRERRLQIVVLDVVEAFLGGEALVEQVEQPCRQRKDEQRAGDAVQDGNLTRQGQAELEEKRGKTQVLRTSSLQRRIRHWSLVIITLRCNNSAEITAVDDGCPAAYHAPHPSSRSTHAQCPRTRRRHRRRRPDRLLAA